MRSRATAAIQREPVLLPIQSARLRRRPLHPPTRFALWRTQLKPVLREAIRLAYLFGEAAGFHFGEEALDLSVTVETIEFFRHVVVD